MIEGPTNVGVEVPFLGLVWTSQDKDFLNGIVTASAWSEPVATPFKPGFPGWFKRILDHCLKTTIENDGDSERPQLAICFWYGDSPCWLGFP